MTGAFENVLFIGGPPGVGKTTVASILVRRHGLRLYSADTRTWAHRDRAITGGVEAAIRWESLSSEDRIAAPDDELVAMSLHLERGAMMLDDLTALPDSPLIVAEGTVIRPVGVPVGAAAVWLMSAPEHQRQRLSDRDGRSSRLYEVMLEIIADEIAAARAPVIQIGSIAETVSAVENFFAPQLARGPRAATLADRRALLRKANLDVVNQVRGYYARPWAVGNPEAVVRDFICECGTSTCEASVETSVAVAYREPVVLADHS